MTTTYLVIFLVCFLNCMDYKIVSFPSQDLISKAEPNVCVCVCVCSCKIFSLFLFADALSSEKWRCCYYEKSSPSVMMLQRSWSYFPAPCTARQLTPAHQTNRRAWQMVLGAVLEFPNKTQICYGTTDHPHVLTLDTHPWGRERPRLWFLSCWKVTPTLSKYMNCPKLMMAA